MTDRNGIEIDYCPNCRGVWLDRGELDKIIERSSVSMNASKFKSDEFNQKIKYEELKKPHYKKHKGFFGELFDF
jgi:Zn-finger nucleic acid-binding protein